MSVRKNFVFSEEIAAHLKELAQEEGRSMTAVVEEMIEDRYRSSRVKKRLEAFDRSVEIADSLGSGHLSGKSVQSIKAEMNV